VLPFISQQRHGIAAAVPPQDSETALAVVVADPAAQNPEIRSLPAV
jgi:hypothetical protein